MKNVLFDFKVDESTNSILITREFEAELSLVWDAFTKPELLDQWWAPKPYHIETKKLELNVGGTWLYAMVSPANEKMWCKADYKAVIPKNQLSWLDAFCDENGKENDIKPRSLWTNKFTEINGTTTVHINLQHEKLQDMEMMISMGFKEGFSMAIGNLDDLLKAKK